MSDREATVQRPTHAPDFLVRLISSALIGFIIGLASAIFLRILDWGITLVWQEIPYRLALGTSAPFYPLIICTLIIHRGKPAAKCWAGAQLHGRARVEGE